MVLSVKWFFNYILGSFTVWLLISLASIELGERMLTNQWNSRPIVNSVARVLAFKEFCKKPQKVDLVLLGSSLTIAATLERRIDRDTSFVPDKWAERLSLLIGRPIGVANLAWHGGMIIDCNKTLLAFLQSQKRPKLAILMTAPRDFSDHLVPEAGALAGVSLSANPVYLDLTSLKVMNVALISRGILEALVPTELLHRIDMAGDSPSFPTVVFVALSLYSKAFQSCESKRNDISSYSCKALHRAGTLREASAASSETRSVSVGSPTLFDRDLGNYAQRYNPANFKRLEQSKQELIVLSRICKLHGVKLMVVNMPITRNNRDLIESKFYNRFIAHLNTLGLQQYFEFVNADSSSLFNNTDFVDSVHLNERGSKKLEFFLAPYIARHCRGAI